jgi:hypothetical protein
MQIKIRQVTIAQFVLFSLFTCSHAQYVPFFPTEIYFSPLGFTNNLPGCDPKLNAGFSAIKLILDKDLPSTKKLANSFSFIGNFEHYLDYTKARGYFPLMLNPTLRSHFFCTEIFTVGFIASGDYELYPDIDKSGNAICYNHFELKMQPFFYVIPTPNTIVKVLISAKGGRNSSNAGQDYNLFRYEVTGIYLTTRNTRVFLVPYLYNDRYLNLPARSADGSLNAKNPNLREQGYGCALGLRHGSFKWGYSEGAFEYERNTDVIYDANSYQKFKGSVRFQNQYIAKKYGYALSFDYTRYLSKNAIYGFQSATQLNERLGQIEIVGDVMLIYNLNRNVSLRPEYTKLYKNVIKTYRYDKDRVALTLHVLW